MPVFDTSTVVIGLVASMWLAIYLAPKVGAYRERRRQELRLYETWGQPLRRRREHRPVAARTPSTAPPGHDRLDEATWADLDMAHVFTRVDRTLSSVGAQTLHRMLRCPPLDPAAMERRRALVTAVAADSDARVQMQRALLRLGDAHGWQAWYALAGLLPVLPGPVWLLRLLPPTMLGTLVAGVVLEHSTLVIIGLALGFALPLIHTVANRTIGHHLGAVSDLRRLLDVAAGLHRALPLEVRALVGDGLDRVASLRRVFGRQASLPNLGWLGGAPELAAEYSKAFALTELVGYQKATRAIARHRAEYDRILDVVGEIDAALGIAYLRAHDEELHAAIIEPEALALKAEGLCHPLVPDAVGNDVELGPRGLLITGSNMAGKSTLLRAIGVDLVLAQSLGVTAASRWCSRPLRVATAMSVRDDLAAGVSLYRAEVDRIHALVDRAGGDHLFLLDEAFRGTNPHERVAASAAVLRHLAQRDLVVAATHDRELCELLEGTFSFGFFTEQVEGDDVVFDYRLRPGVLQTTNAIALLERTGFPPEIVAQARKIAAEPPQSSALGSRLPSVTTQPDRAGPRW